jgi:hypothetical protein
VLDLTCDYSRADCCLSKTDDRCGQTRLMLMVQADHKRPLFSLLDYHRATLSVLAALAAGKNRENQGKIGTLLPLSTITSNILYADVSPEGLPEPRLRSGLNIYRPYSYIRRPPIISIVQLKCPARNIS